MRGELAGDPDEEARQIVLRELTLRARTHHELAERLRGKGIPSDSIERVLHRMRGVGLVDDDQFAADWVASRQRRRHLSRRVLRQELSRKGVEAETIEAALEGVGSDDERAAALELAHKKMRAMRGLDRQVQRRRLGGALARKGFGPGIVASVVSDVLAESAQAEGEDAWPVHEA